jgi:hypothetical protein
MSVSGDKAVEKKQKTRDAARDKASADGWKGFVNVELSDAHKPQVKLLAQEPQDVWDEILSMVESDYKLTVSYDGNRSTWNASLTCRNPQDRNGGLTLTGRGGSFIGAAAALVFKHVRVLNRDWSKALTQTGLSFEPDDVG